MEEGRGLQQYVVAARDTDDRGQLGTARLVQFADVGDEVDAVVVRGRNFRPSVSW
ncbi:hypothetical protein ACFQ3Z_01370 [Streptomyces nogalater]